jgi:hypothetical protein
MHERESDKECESVPALPPTIADDGDLRRDWVETAEYIADVESRIGDHWQWQATEGHGPPEDDSSRPGFVIVGRRAYIDFVATVASGITEHGQAFAAWAQLVKDSTELRHFEEAYLGRYESVEHFALAVLAELGPQLLDEPSENGQLRVVSNPRELAALLLQRGDIRVVSYLESGVFVFRNTDFSDDERAGATEGGRDE